MSSVIKRACDIRDDLAKFDRQLADSMRPITDLNELHEGKSHLYSAVIDKFTQGKQSKSDAEELVAAVDRMQVQLKRQVRTL